jgi:hypothetical protein
VGGVHSVSDPAQIGTEETGVLSLQRLRKLAGFFQQHCDRHFVGPTLKQQAAREGDRPARFQDVVDEENVASGDFALDVANERDLAGRHLARVVTR